MRALPGPHEKLTISLSAPCWKGFTLMCWQAAVAQPGSVKHKPAGAKNHCLGHAGTLHRVIRLNRISLARLAQSAERKALNLVVVGSSPTVGVFCSTQNGFPEQGEWFQQSPELLDYPVASNHAHPIPFYRKIMPICYVSSVGLEISANCLGANEIISMENKFLGQLEWIPSDSQMGHEHQWSSGRIHRCHRCDPGSIPG